MKTIFELVRYEGPDGDESWREIRTYSDGFFSSLEKASRAMRANMKHYNRCCRWDVLELSLSGECFRVWRFSPEGELVESSSSAPPSPESAFQMNQVVRFFADGRMAHGVVCDVRLHERGGKNVQEFLVRSYIWEPELVAPTRWTCRSAVPLNSKWVFQEDGFLRWMDRALMEPEALETMDVGTLWALARECVPADTRLKAAAQIQHPIRDPRPRQSPLPVGEEVASAETGQSKWCSGVLYSVSREVCENATPYFITSRSEFLPGFFRSRDEAIEALREWVRGDPLAAWSFDGHALMPSGCVLQYLVNVEPLDFREPENRPWPDPWSGVVYWHFDRRGQCVGFVDRTNSTSSGIDPEKLHLRIGTVVTRVYCGRFIPHLVTGIANDLSKGFRERCMNDSGLFVEHGELGANGFLDSSIDDEAELLLWEGPLSEACRNRLALNLLSKDEVEPMMESLIFAEGKSWSRGSHG